VNLFELEQAATVLGWELLHNRSIAEAELALWATSRPSCWRTPTLLAYGRTLKAWLRPRSNARAVSCASGPCLVGPMKPARKATARPRLSNALRHSPFQRRGAGRRPRAERSELGSVISSECGGRSVWRGRSTFGGFRSHLQTPSLCWKLTSSRDRQAGSHFRRARWFWRLLARSDAKKRPCRTFVDYWVPEHSSITDREHRSELLKDSLCISQ